MPAIYAHNQFGNKVLREMDETIRMRALRYLPLFRIGLQEWIFCSFIIRSGKMRSVR